MIFVKANAQRQVQGYNGWDSKRGVLRDSKVFVRFS
jgi:hypothetical protein